MRIRIRGEYPANWKDIATQVKTDAGWQCVRCGHPHDPPAGRCLTVHHLDGDKANCEWYNLAALCQACHLRIQGRVVMERQWYLPHSGWFQPYVAGYYAAVHGEPTDRDFVLANIDRLLAIGQGREIENGN